MSSFREKLLKGERLHGTIVSVASPTICELLAHAGFDWLFIDAEHGPLDAAEIQDLIRAAGLTPCLVRVPTLDEVAIKRVLDAGAEGIIVPRSTAPMKQNGRWPMPNTRPWVSAAWASPVPRATVLNWIIIWRGPMNRSPRSPTGPWWTAA